MLVEVELSISLVPFLGGSMVVGVRHTIFGRVLIINAECAPDIEFAIELDISFIALNPIGSLPTSRLSCNGTCRSRSLLCFQNGALSYCSPLIVGLMLCNRCYYPVPRSVGFLRVVDVGLIAGQSI